MTKSKAEIPNRPLGALFTRAQSQLGMTHAGIGELLGVSARTVGRWHARSPYLTLDNLVTLARHVYAKDPQLAEELAGAASESLESIGLVAPAQPPAPPRAPPALVVDAVVCAAAEALDASPKMVRGAVHAAFKRARELQLSMQDVESALAAASTKAGAPKR